MPDDASPPDDPQVRRRLEAARGYCDLGLPQMAREELAPLQKKFGRAPEVIEAGLTILMQERHWADALALALQLRDTVPAHPAGWLQSAFCLHELSRTREALELLVAGPRDLRKEALFHYNCGCYFAVLDQPREALAALRRAFDIDAGYRKNAKQDQDLVSLREQL